MKTIDEQREKDIRAVCEKVVSLNIKDTGDYGSGGECPLCGMSCLWNAFSVSDIQHEPDCIYLIAKDLLTK
jgi:hypothetical protein